MWNWNGPLILECAVNDSSDEDSESENYVEDVEGVEDEETDVVTPKKSVRFAPISSVLEFDENVLNDSPAKRTRSKQKKVPTKDDEPSTPLDSNSKMGPGKARRRSIG